MNKKKATNEKFCKAILGELVDKRFHGTCSIQDYCISREDECKLVKTLPMIFTNNFVDFKVIVIKDKLKFVYNNFINKIVFDSLRSFTKNNVEEYIDSLTI